MEKDILLLVVGCVVGAMNAIAGGGMLVGFPVLVALGIPPLTANATGGLISAPGQMASAFGYRNYLRRIPKRYAWLLVPCFIGAIFGALILRNTPPGDFNKMIPVLVLFGIVLFAFQPLLHFHLHKQIVFRRRAVPPLVIIGLALLPIAFYGAYFGPGYGFLMLAFLGFTKLPDTHMINAAKNVSATVVAGTAVACLTSAHLIDWHAGLFMATGSVIGGYAGARGAQKVSHHWLRIAIILIGLAAVVYLGLQEY